MNLPKNLNETLDFLINADKNQGLKEWLFLEEDKAVGTIHFFGGMRLRNDLGLWGETDLTKWFNSIGIIHPDDMSGIIFTSLHRKLNNKEIDLKEQVKMYQNYWKKMGIPDGIPKKEE